MRIDTNIFVRNLTTITQTLSLKAPKSRWSLDTITTITVAPFGVVSIPMYFHDVDYGNHRSILRISNGNTIVNVSLLAQHYPDILKVASCYYYDERVPVGASTCLPFVISNTTGSPVNIYSLNHDVSSTSPTFDVDTLIPFPFVVLPGESINIASVCFTPQTPNIELIYETFILEYSINGTKKSFGVQAFFSSEVDTTLLKNCIEPTETSVLFGSVLFGGSVEKTVTFRSNRYKPQFINSIDFPDEIGGVFNVVGSPFPLQVDSLSTASVTVEFRPTLTQPIVKDRFATLVNVTTNLCSTQTLNLTAFALQPTADSISTPLFPDKEYILAMSSSAPSFSQDFHFVNNSLTNVKIVSVGFADSSPEFVITGVQPTNTLPFTLAPGEKMSIGVLFTPSQTGKVFFNQLLITTDQGLKSLSYPLQALRTTTSSVYEVSEPSVSMSLVPNPATTNVTVKTEGVVISELSLYDILGKAVKTIINIGVSGFTLGIDNSIPSGSYIVRITGKTLQGKLYVISKSLVVE